MKDEQAQKEEFLECFPALVYKYRHWADPYHRGLLTHNQIYLARPKDLNDPHDCNYPLCYDLLAPDEMQQLVLRVLVRLHPNWGKVFILEEAQRILGRGHLTNKEYLRSFSDQVSEQHRALVGIFSASRTPSNEVMWAHYAKDHSGFCVGFDTWALHGDAGGTIGEVTYVPTKEPIKPRPDLTHLIQRLNTKSKRWTYEEEVRISRTFAQPDSKDRLVTLQSSTIRQVCLGYKISPEHEEEILASIEGREDLHHVEVVKMQLDPKQFDLSSKVIRAPRLPNAE